MKDNFNFIDVALDVIQQEIEGLQQLPQYIDDNFSSICKAIIATPGKVVVMGVGKSGHIANKISATLASTGTPAFFVHPGEASHGDLGMVSKNDLIIAISNSGESNEILALIPSLKRQHIPLVCITSNPTSSMAQLSDYHLQVKVSKEACPLGLAPTTSTTAVLAMGDALAVSLLQARDFTAEDFALSHPGGALGRRLLLKLSDLMHSGEQLPIVNGQTKLSDALLEVSQKGLGMTTVVDDSGNLIGIFTDGDLRRILDKRIDVHQTEIQKVMTMSPTTATPDMLAIDGLHLMQKKSINGLVLCEQRRPVGALNMHDLLKAGVM
ncbi:KpsF/GutQ family sugar-phosphate isomerase [Vibrio sp.]|nr:KpsF/GutQ family sugar-phosphate isomerase [Vibrio sp.]